MKTLVSFLAIVAFVGATEIVDPLASRSISSSVEDKIINMRDQMPCGFPKMGIPPLAPFVVNQKDVNINIPGFSLNSTVNNFAANNLNFFNITEMKINIIKRTVTSRFAFKNVSVDTWYSLKLFLETLGITMNMIGDGHAKFEIKEFEIWSTLKYSLNIISNKLKLKSLDIRTHMGPVESNIGGILGDGPINKQMNKLLEVFVPTIINTNKDLISKNIESISLPLINDFLSKYKLKDLLAIIGGGSGEPIKCEPLNQ